MSEESALDEQDQAGSRDLLIAFETLMMRFDERFEMGEDEYFRKTYGVSETLLNELWKSMVSEFFEDDDKDIESLRDWKEFCFSAFLVAYESGRTHEQIIKDGVSGLS